MSDPQSPKGGDSKGSQRPAPLPPSSPGQPMKKSEDRPVPLRPSSPGTPTTGGKHPVKPSK